MMGHIPWKPIAWGLAAGAVGVLLTKLVLGAADDHTRLNQLWDLELRRAQATMQQRETPTTQAPK